MNMKRVLALILAGIMLLGAAGVAVFAADNGVATIEGTSLCNAAACVGCGE